MASAKKTFHRPFNNEHLANRLRGGVPDRFGTGKLLIYQDVLYSIMLNQISINQSSIPKLHQITNADTQFCTSFVSNIGAVVNTPGNDIESRLSQAVRTAFQPRIETAFGQIRQQHAQKFSSIPAEALFRVNAVHNAAAQSFGEMLNSIAVAAVSSNSIGSLKSNDDILAFCTRFDQLIDIVRDKVLDDLVVFSSPLDRVNFLFF